MDEMMTLETTPEDAVTLKKAIEEIFEKMDQADQRIRQNQGEIDRLKVETQAILKGLKVTA